jgi:peroxiredoxin
MWKLSNVLIAVGIAAAGVAAAGQTPSPTDVAFNDLKGNSHKPLAQKDVKATVLFFVLTDCPVSNSYGPEIQRICAEYAPKKVAAFVIHPDPDVTAQQAAKHAKEYGYTCPVLRDPSHLIVKATGVTMAPEVAVIGPGSKVLYRGRIDDIYQDYGKRRAEPSQRDLRNALDAILQGKAVATPTTKVIGCYLPDPVK